MGGDIRTLQGLGEAHIHDGNLGELPAYLGLLALLNRTLSNNVPKIPIKTAFDSVDLVFRISHGLWSLDPIKFTGNALSLQGRGTLDPQTNLDLRLEPLLGRDRFHIPIVSEVSREASRPLVNVHITGTLRAPTRRSSRCLHSSATRPSPIAGRRGPAGGVSGRACPSFFPHDGVRVSNARATPHPSSPGAGGDSRVDVIAIARLVVDPVQGRLQVEPGIGIVSPHRHGDHRQSLPERDRPESGVETSFGPADQDRVRTTRTVVRGHRRPAAQEIDLDQVDRAVEDLHALGEVLLSIGSGVLVRGAQQLDDRDQLTALAGRGPPHSSAVRDPRREAGR